VQSVATQLSQAVIDDPQASVREVGLLVAALDQDVIKDTFDNLREAKDAFEELAHARGGVALGIDHHYAIVTDATFSGDALALTNALMSGDRLSVTVAGVDIAADVVSHALSPTPLGPAAHVVVSIVKVAAPFVAAYERVRAKAKVPVPALQEQLMRSYTARLTGFDSSANSLRYRSVSLPPP
jgi:hypothetical protein